MGVLVNSILRNLALSSHSYPELTLTKVLVRGNKRVETFGLGAGEKFPVLEVAPASFVGSLNGMARQVISQGDGSPLVEEELHH
jgi:hypothetical protein